MKYTSFSIILIILFFSKSFAQEITYNTILIPAELKENANAVVRYDSKTIDIIAVDKQVIKTKNVVTVLNKLGKQAVRLAEYYDNDTSINKLQVTIYDALGNKIKKYNKGKFIDVHASDDVSIYTDNRVKYVEYTPTNYPYTVVFESETENSSTAFIPKWYPIGGYYRSVEESVFKINNPLKVPFRKKEANFNGFSIKNLSDDTKIHYELTKVPAVKYERYALNFSEMFPNLKIALNEFSLKGVKAKAENWKQFGLWMDTHLLKQANDLDQATINKAKELTKNASSAEEKAKIIYNYVQNRTRYVSVQIDIGGWKPIPASEVHKLGYGDCKGLTNYTKALLEAVGVKAYYTVVFAGDKKNIDHDFSSFQGNHVILNIPNKVNDLWLECTSQTIPFGFLGDFTDDRDVLVITENGGEIKHTPSYNETYNLQTVKATINLDDLGNIKADVERISFGTQYDEKYLIENKSKEDLFKYYKSNVWDYNNNLEIETINVFNNKDSISFKEKAKINIDEYAVLNDNELLFRINIFNKYSFVPKRYRTRKLPVTIERGFLDKDEYIITVPKKYSNKIVPIQKEIENKFGTYKVTIKPLENNKIAYTKYFLLKKGNYSKEEYKAFRSFLKKVAKFDNLRIALPKL